MFEHSGKLLRDRRLGKPRRRAIHLPVGVTYGTILDYLSNLIRVMINGHKVAAEHPLYLRRGNSSCAREMWLAALKQKTGSRNTPSSLPETQLERVGDKRQ